MNSLILTFKSLGWKKFLRLTVDLSLPVSMLAILIIFAPSTSFLTLFLLPFVLPLLATNFQKVWYAAMGRDDTKISPVDFGNYYKNGGLYGSLGIGGTTILSLLIGYFSFSILTMLLLSPLATAFGQKEVIDNFTSLWTTNQNEAVSYLSKNISSLTGTITVLISLAIFIALLFFFISFSKSVQGYSLFQRVMPDADKNFLGGQARIMGKTLLRGTFSLRLSINWLLLVLFGLATLIIYGGFTALFSLIPSSFPLLTCALPAGITILLLTPLYTLLLASNILTADAIMPTVADNLSDKEIAYLEGVFNNKNYVHTKESEGQVPFQGKGRTVTAPSDSPVFDATVEKKPDDDLTKQDQQSQNEDKKDESSSDKKDSPSFGFFDFSSDEKKNDSDKKD